MSALIAALILLRKSKRGLVKEGSQHDVNEFANRKTCEAQIRSEWKIGELNHKHAQSFERMQTPKIDISASYSEYWTPRDSLVVIK